MAAGAARCRPGAIVAGSGRLTVRRPVRFAALAAIVFALHFVVLHWFAEALEGPLRLKPMTKPMFTRLLRQEAPPAVITMNAQAPRAKRTRRAITASKPAPPAALPAQAAASPPRPEASAALPQVAASAPAVAAASAPQAPASAAIVLGADTWPVDTRLNYRLTGWYDGDLTGTASVQWLRQEDRYETRVDLDLGIFGMQFLSQGSVTVDSLSPRAYQETRPGRVRGVQLGPENVTLNDGRTVPRPPGAQDTASHFVELSHRYSSGKEKLEVGGQTSVWIARPGGVDLWFYDIVSIDSLATPRLGTVPAYHLKPRPIADARGDIYAEIWIAPTLQYLPVRIKITQGSRWVDITVDRIEQR